MRHPNGKHGPTMRPNLYARVLSLGWECVWCGGPFDNIDHVVPKALGGGNEYTNLVPSCFECNSLKADLPLDLWLDGEDMIHYSARLRVEKRVKAETATVVSQRMASMRGNLTKRRRKIQEVYAKQEAAFWRRKYWTPGIESVMMGPRDYDDTE